MHGIHSLSLPDVLITAMHRWGATVSVEVYNGCQSVASLSSLIGELLHWSPLQSHVRAHVQVACQPSEQDAGHQGVLRMEVDKEGGGGGGRG